VERSSENILVAVKVPEAYPKDALKEARNTLQSIWPSLVNDPDVRDRLGELDPENPPFGVEARESQFGPIEAILISVAGGLARDGATWIWKEKIWPLLRAKLGADFEEE
jgi:hypothetical protein